MSEEVGLEQALATLGAPTWRDRKQAADAVVAALAIAEPEPRDAAIEHLISLVVSADLEPRAGARDVLVRHAAFALPALRRRIDSPRGERAHVELLAEIADDTDTERLVSRVDPHVYDANTRTAAIAGLGRIANTTAIAALCDTLGDTSETLRIAALEALREANAAVDPRLLVPLLVYPICRRAAATVLGQTRSPDAVAPLIGMLLDPMAGVRAATAVALTRLDDDLEAAGHTYVVGAMLTGVDGDTKSRLRGLLEHKLSNVRQGAMRLCALAGDVDAIAVLLDVMDDPVALDRGVAMVAAFGASANAVLRVAATRVAPAQREQLFRLVGALPVGRVDPQLLEALTNGLGDSLEDSAIAAAESLAVIGDRTCLAPLYRAMAHDGRLGETAADAVAAILGRSASSAEDLTLIVGSPWPHEAALARNLCRVAGALRSARWALSLVGLLGSADSTVRVAAAIALGNVPGDHEGADALAFALADEEPLVRAAACRALASLASPQAPHALLSATHDRSPQVRAAAAAALVALDNPVALPRLRAMVNEDAAPAVVVQAIAGIGRSGADQDLTMLMSLSLSTDHEVVKAAARALGGFVAHRATAALIGLLSHARWDVRWTAAGVLAGRRDRTALAPASRALDVERDPLVRQVLADAVAELGGTPPAERRG